VPKLWEATIEAHRREVRDAILDTTAALASQHGVLSVTMSQVAEETGIGRATLYKYFPDVEAILLAWRDRNIAMHLEQLRRLAEPGASPWADLVAVLEAYALIRHQHPHDSELATFLHRPEHLARPQQQVSDFIRPLIAEAAKTGDVRDDVAPQELAQYCVHALGAAAGLRGKTGVQRLVAVVLAGLRPEAAARH
jgi:AcrR family transcriptional regulator